MPRKVRQGHRRPESARNNNPLHVCHDMCRVRRAKVGPGKRQKGPRTVKTLGRLLAPLVVQQEPGRPSGTGSGQTTGSQGRLSAVAPLRHRRGKKMGNVWPGNSVGRGAGIRIVCLFPSPPHASPGGLPPGAAFPCKSSELTPSPAAPRWFRCIAEGNARLTAGRVQNQGIRGQWAAARFLRSVAVR